MSVLCKTAQPFYIALILSLLPLPASAHFNLHCTSCQSLLEQLQDRFGERPTAMGESNGRYSVVLTENAQTGSWTWILLLPDGRACIADGGKKWRVIGQEKS